MNPFRDGGCDGSVLVVPDHNRELVTAEAGGEVVGPHATLQAAGELDQERVAAVVPEGVVDVLEVVDIYDQQPLVPGAEPCSGLEGSRKTLRQHRAVGQPGPRIMGGTVGQRLMAVVDSGGHGIERLSQFAELIAPDDVDAVAVVTSLQF